MILITGANGALGRAMFSVLKKAGCYKIFTASRNVGTSPTEIKCDVTDPEQIKLAIEIANPKYIIHMAVSYSNNFEEAYATNVLSSKYILDYVKENTIATRVVLIGSAAEYGVIKEQENPVTEQRSLAPVSAYGLTKAWQTQLMYMYAKEVDVLSVRPFTLYGEGVIDLLFAGTLQRQIDEVLSGQRQFIEVGSLAAVRDFITTEEAADLIYKVMLNGNRGETYHIASGKPRSMREFAQMQLQKHGLDIAIVKEGSNPSKRSGYDIPIIYADISKTSELI